MTAEGATFPSQDTPDTAVARTLAQGLRIRGHQYAGDIMDDLCDALDAATARAEAAEQERRANDQAWHITARNIGDERDRARGTAAALEAELAELRVEWTVRHSQGIHPGPFTEQQAREWIEVHQLRDSRRHFNVRGMQRLLRRRVSEWEEVPLAEAGEPR